MKSAFCVLVLLAGACASHQPQTGGSARTSADFDRVAAGLAAGKSIVLTGITPDGMREVVTVTPAQAMPVEQAKRVAEAARGTLDSHGLRSPGAWEIAIVLVGGRLVTRSGIAEVPGLVMPADPSKPILLSMRSFAGSPANYSSLMRGLTRGTAITLRAPDERRVRFVLPGAMLSTQDAHGALQRVADQLAARGIHDPTPEELHAALRDVLQTDNRHD